MQEYNTVFFEAEWGGDIHKVTRIDWDEKGDIINFCLNGMMVMSPETAHQLNLFIVMQSQHSGKTRLKLW